MDPALSTEAVPERHLRRSLGLFDSSMIVAGSMVGSGIFLVSAQVAREVDNARWFLVAWLIATVLTVTAALSYGELAAMMPDAGGQYVYLREAFSPVWGFLYGWTLFLVIQTGTIDAVAIGFARYLGILWPSVSERNYLVAPIHISTRYALSFSTVQLAAVVLILMLTWANSRGLRYGKLVQNTFTVAKLAGLAGVIVAGLLIGRNAAVVQANFARGWTALHAAPEVPGAHGLAFRIFVGLCLAQVGALFAADAWNNITFTAGEVKDPKRNLPRSLLLGTSLVMVLYLLANLAYAVVLPLAQIQHPAEDRVSAAMLQKVFPVAGGVAIAIIIVIASIGCVNGMILAGARTFYAMAKDRLFFKSVGGLNGCDVPGAALRWQALWACCLLLVRTYDPATGTYGNLYSNLLDWVISATLLFYILTILAVFRLRITRPDAERPYRIWGYPFVPLLYIVGASILVAVLFRYRAANTIPGLIVVFLGLPVYSLLRISHRH
jgi:APA family basic amino acid/polyamine antiporter